MTKKFNRFIYLTITVIMATLFVLCGCSARNVEQKQKTLLFGATYMTRNNPFFDVVNQGISEVITENGDRLLTRDPLQDQQKQNQQILELIDEGICVLFLNPVDLKAVSPALDACQKAGVVVINVDTAVKDTEKVISIIETNNYQAGRLCALDMLKRRAQANIVILDNPIQMSITNRVKGFTDVIADNDNFKIVYQEAGAGEIEVAAKVMENFLQKKIPFDVVLGGNDPTALGALAAMQQAGRAGDVLIYGIDGSPDFKAMLEVGYVTGTSAQHPKLIGQTAAQTAYKYLAGEDIKEYISLPSSFITKDNLQDYEINGWQ